MANTEGIPDEHLASLLSLSTSPPIVSRAKRSNARMQRKDRLAKRDKALRAQQEPENSPSIVENQSTSSSQILSQNSNVSVTKNRTENKTLPPATSRFRRFHRENMMDLPDGMTPSAKVIRRSTNSKKIAVQKQKVPIPTETETISSQSQDHDNQEESYDTNHNQNRNQKNRPSIIRSEMIQERPIQIHPNHKTQNKQESMAKKVSRFKQRQRADFTITKPQTKNGFPSLDMPVGTFVRRKPNSNILQGTKKNLNQSNIESESVKQTKESVNTSDNGADQILNSMSPEQIQDGVRELESTLSPDLIAFLRKRGKTKQNKTPINTIEKTNANDLSKKGSHTTESQVGPSTNAPISILKKSDESLREEKKRTAQILSSIKSVQDLDAAFENMSMQSSPTEEPSMPLKSSLSPSNTIDKNTGEETVDKLSDMITPTALLRSSSSHQRLLAAKTVSSLLEKDVQLFLDSKKSFLSSSSISTNSETPDSNEDTGHYNRYPTVLPVALRCLLDLPSPHKHLVLHRYVLNSLYFLLLQFSHPEHRVNLKKLSESNSCDPSFLYQYYFMEDNIPSQPTTSLYKTSSPPTPEESQSKPAAKPHLPACYATDSSAQSASLDGMAFYKDPMWTLLSRMRILPCLSHLLHHCQGRYQNTSSMRESFNNQKVTSNDNHHDGSIREEKIEDSKSSRNASDFNSQMMKIPEESWISICGILTMVSLRSPGAACAIGQHESLLKEIIRGTLALGVSNDLNLKDDYDEYGEPNKNNDDVGGNGRNSVFAVNTRVALPALILLCGLARQSRVVASCEEPFASLMTTLIAILGMEAENEDERMVQFYSITLWRILLRYGLAIPHLPTMLSISTPYLSTTSSAFTSPQHLIAEYLTSFANICECAKIVTRHPFQLQANSAIGTQIKLTLKQRETLASAGGWLGSYARQCATILGSEAVINIKSTCNIKIVAARLRFLSSYVNAVAPTPLSHVEIDERNEEVLLETKTPDEIRDILSKGTFHSMLSMNSCIDAFNTLLQGKEGTRMLDFALDVILQSAFLLNWNDTGKGRSEDLDLEASCASMVKGCAIFLWNMSTSEILHESDDDSRLSKRLGEVMLRFGEIACQAIVRQYAASAQTGKDRDFSSKNDLHAKKFSSPRIGWLNSSHSFLAKFAGFYIRNHIESCGSTDCFSIVRVFVFCLLGRLQPGEEALAAMILSEDINSPHSIQSKKNGDSDENVLFPSPIQKVLIRELCSSKQARNQLLHSAKACRSIGFSADARGPFALESLRSHVDRTLSPVSGEHNTDSNIRRSDFVLPLGQDWLWHVLSSTIQPIDLEKEANNKNSNLVDLKFRGSKMLEEAIQIVFSCLKVLNDMEEEAGGILSLFINQIDQGFKLYHLTNVCLLPEEILRDDAIEGMFLSLFEKISNDGDDVIGMSPLIPSFVKACYKHSQIAQTREEKNVSKSTKTKEEEEAEEKLLFGELNDSSKKFAIFTNVEIRAIQDFMQDFMEAFLQYGAQYKPFILCVRFLIRPGFPPSAISQVLQKLKDAVHLLTVEDLNDDKMNRENLLHALSGGLPSKDGSRRDTPELLDGFSTLLQFKQKIKHESDRSSSPLYFLGKEYLYLVAIGCIGRNLASSLQRCECGVEAAKKRLLGLDTDILCDIFLVTKYLLQDPNGRKKDLVNIVCKVCYLSIESNDLRVKADASDIKERIGNETDLYKNWSKIVNIFRMNSKGIN